MQQFSLEKITELAQADAANHQIKVVVWDALAEAIKAQINKNKDTRFAKACEDVLADNDAFFDLRFVNFTVEAVCKPEDGPGLVFTGKPRKKNPVIFKIPLPDTGRLLMQSDFDHASAQFAELKDTSPEDNASTLPPIVKRLNKAMEDFQKALSLDLSSEQIADLLTRKTA